MSSNPIIAQRARHVAVAGAAAILGTIGITFIIGGNLDGPGPVFTTANIIPELTWGTWAVAGALLLLHPRTRVAGIGLAVAWYATWASVLIVGLVMAGGPFYAVPVYLGLAGGHTLFLAIEIAER